MEENNIIQYNQKGFLLPDSINSMAAYHAKIMPDGTYMFRLHDCNTGAKLVGRITDRTGVEEAIRKLRCLSAAAAEFADFIAGNYPGQ